LHARVAFLPWVPITLKCLKRKEADFEPRTLAEHVKRLRVQRGLTQYQTARLLKVSSWTIRKWENGHTTPPVAYLPALIRFLGYDPFPQAHTLPERLRAKRRAMGWSIRAAARGIGVDAGAWSDWEEGGVILFRNHRRLVAQLLDLPIEQIDEEMRSRWNAAHRGRGE